MLKWLALPIDAFKFVRDVIRILLKAKFTYLAASISFFMLLSLVPFLLLVISIFGYIAKGDVTQFTTKITNYIESPILKESVQKIVEFASKYREILGLIGLLALFWTSKSVVFALDFGLNTIMGTTARKNYFRKLLDTLIMIIMVLALFICSMLLVILTSYVNAKHFALAGQAGEILQGLWQAVGGYLPYAISLLIAFLLFYSIYLIIPRYPKEEKKLVKRIGAMPYKSILTGAIFGAVIWQITSGLFSWYLSKQTVHYQIVYGSMAAFIFIILWVYFFSISILIGGAVIKVLIDKNQS